MEMMSGLLHHACICDATSIGQSAHDCVRRAISQAVGVVYRLTRLCAPAGLMNSPRISIPRQYGASDRSRRSELRMPAFFRKIFYFKQMDFEMAVWEMTHLLIAPKKVFKSIYYHKRMPRVSQFTNYYSSDHTCCRDEAYISPPGSLLYLSPLPIPPPHLLRLVASIHAGLLECGEIGSYVCVCTFRGWVGDFIDRCILLGGTLSRPWNCWASRQKTTTRLVWPTRRHKRRCA
jgi:hypothetical protein